MWQLGKSNVSPSSGFFWLFVVVLCCSFSDISEVILLSHFIMCGHRNLWLSANDWTEVFLAASNQQASHSLPRGSVCVLGQAFKTHPDFTTPAQPSLPLYRVSRLAGGESSGPSYVSLSMHSARYVPSCIRARSILHSQEYTVAFQCPLQISHATAFPFKLLQTC